MEERRKSERIDLHLLAQWETTSAGLPLCHPSAAAALGNPGLGTTVIFRSGPSDAGSLVIQNTLGLTPSSHYHSHPMFRSERNHWFEGHGMTGHKSHPPMLGQ